MATAQSGSGNTHPAPRGAGGEAFRFEQVARLAAALDARGETEQAIALYRRVLDRAPRLAAAHYNLALLYRRNRQYLEALSAYHEALRLGIDRPEEVYSNLGVLYAELRRPDDAVRMYEAALAIEPTHLPALFNAGGLAEETGDAECAEALYRRILALDPRHAGALSRLAHMRRISDPADPLVASLRAAMDDAEPAAREALAFALGKVLDDLGQHDDAFAAWRAGNELVARRLPPYDRHATEAAFDALAATFTREWIDARATASEEAPIFVCGMFRSGSTLLERMLAAHPAVTAGGELDVLPWLVARRLSPYPQRAASATAAELEALAARYVDHVRTLLPGAARVTDKRPDNFLYLGIAKAMFPRARIVVTRRDPLDNCLSIFARHLGGLTYATDLAHAAHYWREHERLVEHWKGCFGDDLFVVDYDELVRAPEPLLRSLLEFLGLAWDARCLDPARAAGSVATDSLWQVREPLHARASGRARRYLRFLDAARAELAGSRVADMGGSDDLRLAAAWLGQGRHAEAERLLRGELAKRPDDVDALALLADALARGGRFHECEVLLRRCLALAPESRAARHNLAVALLRQGRPEAALEEARRLLAGDTSDTRALRLEGAILMQLLRHDAAIESYQRALAREPDAPGTWSSLGHALRIVGRLDESVAAYRRAIALAPERGEPYWNIANLKTVRLGDDDLRAMRSALERPGLPRDDRVQLHFALGRALEQRGDFRASFRHYAEGNRLRREALPYAPEELTAYVARCRELFTARFFAEREGCGCRSAEPVFVVGLPRSGSTLVEQILASHSRVEGTTELAHVAAAAHSLAALGLSYPEALLELDPKRFVALGRGYLERTRPLRRTHTPHFIDKMPDNFRHLALIHLMLPQARIIDVRRHPMACGLSLFTHLFAHGQHFAYDLGHIGRCYRDYLTLMAHFDAVLPGRVHRVHYESLVEDTEREVRRLLDYCGLPFEEACLRWFENPRAVATASSEQVRSPISREPLEHWRRFEPWLEPLARALGTLVHDYPAV